MSAGATTSPLSGRRVFVTGAFGLLGSQLVKRLLVDGAQVIVLRRDEVSLSALSLEGTQERVTIVSGDICDAPLIQRVLAEHAVQDVFHLAAQTIVGVANRAPVSTFESNIRGTWTVLEACRSVAVDSVVVAASDKAYGPHEDLPYREQHSLEPIYPYDVSKAATDMIARCYHSTFGLPVAVTRFANLYGGGDLNMSRLIPEVVRAAIAGRRPVIRSDGTLERDFLYVEDAVAAYLAIWQLVRDGRGAGEAFNAGGDEPHSVLEIVRLALQAAGADLEPDVRGAPNLSGEILRQYVDSSKLREWSGWSPAVELPDGLRRTVDWYRAHLAHLAV